jgi:Fic family protein
MADSRWPAVVVEERPWRTNPDQRGLDGSRPNQRERMLTTISVEIPARIANQPVHLAPETTAACEAAAQRISALESRAEHLGGLGELLVRTEAVASSKIEHIYADLDDIARASLGEQASDKARRTVAAGQALTTLTDSCNDAAPLTEQAILDAHHALLHDDRLEGAWAGRYREQQNWIGGSDFSPISAVHVPPPREDVEPLMADLIKFANRNDLSAISQAAVVHAQFEAIHPFTDGNGRVGRGLIGAALRRRQITSSITVPVAAAMLSAVDDYFDKLRDFRQGDLDSITDYVAQSALAAADASVESADRLAELPARWRDLVSGRRGSSSRALVDGLLRAPILDIARAERITGSTRARTYEAIDRLEEAGVLHEITGGSRNRIWVVTDVMTELRDLENRIGIRAAPSARWRRPER